MWRFTDFGNTNANTHGQTKGIENSKRIERNSAPLFTTTVCVVSVALLVITSVAESNISISRKIETLNVIPGNARSNSWKNTRDALIQDVNQDALYQKFSKSNSAYLEGDKPVVSDTTISPDVSETQTVEEAQTDEPTTPESETVSNESQSPESAPSSESNTTNSSEPQSEESAPQTLREDFSELFAYAYRPLPHALKSITSLPSAEASVTTDAVPNEEEVPPVTDTTLSEHVPVTPEETVADQDVETSSETEVSSSVPSTEEETLSPEALLKQVQENANQKVTRVDEYNTELHHATEPISEEPADENEVDRSESIIFSDFALPQLNSGQFIQNTQLRISLAGSAREAQNGLYPSAEVEYSFGKNWISAGTILLDDEVSNAINGGYFLFALPKTKDASELKNLRVRVSYVGEKENLNDLYIDSVWLELNTETFDREVLQERLFPKYLPYGKLPEMHELISSELDFGRTEDPKFVLRYESQRNIIVRFFRSIFADNLASIHSLEFIREDVGPVDVTPELNQTPDGLWTIQFDDEDKEKLQPGTYTVKLVVDEGGKSFTDTFDFQWGMIAINPNQTEYTVGDTAGISLAALSTNGNTICDANLALYIVDPNQFISHVPVFDSGLCNGNNVVTRPDYLAEFPVDIPGTYEMYVEHIGANGEVLTHTSDSFSVVEDQTIWIERNGPTRIYPPAMYPMQITVKTKDAFKGSLTERVPKDFVVRDTDAVVLEHDGVWELSWNLDLAASSSATFSYSFDAPDISPYLYTLGPAEISSDAQNMVIQEALPTKPEEMLAETIITDTNGETVSTDSGEATVSVDDQKESELAPEPESEPAPTQKVETDTPEPPSSTEVIETEHSIDSMVNDSVPTPAPETEEVEEEPSLFEKAVDFIFGSGDSDSENQETETETEQNVNSKTSEVETPSILEKAVDFIFGADEEVSPGEDAVTEPLSTPEVVEPNDSKATSTTTFVESRKWQIASDATGSMLLYWASTTIPSGWTCVSCRVTDVFYQRFIMGSSTAGSNGGSATHTHTANGNVGITSGSQGVANTGANVATLAHTHSYTPTISTASNLPSNRHLVVIQYNSAGSPESLPTGAIAIFDATVPTGWTRYSAQDGYFIRGESTTTIGTATTSSTHQHNISGTTGGSAGAVSIAAPGTASNVGTNGHTHTVSTTTVAIDHEPRYREVIMGRLNATSSPADAMIAMWTDTPPTGWSTISSTSQAFDNRFAKASTTYGAIGGVATSTHADISNIITTGPSATIARDNAPVQSTVSSAGHTHAVTVTNFSWGTNTPPYRTAIFAKRSPGGEVPSAPTVHVLFDNEKTGTSTPRFEFTGNDPDGTEPLVYEFQWDDDEDLETAPIGDRTSDNEVGCSPNCFTNTASTTNTSPFTDNERIRFSMQTALSSGTTYYYRVRVKESVTGTWSSWSGTQSFTYTSGTDPSEWMQTEGTQFDGGTLTRTATTSGGVQLSTTSQAIPTVASGWTSNTAAGSAALTLTKPSNVEAGDLLIIIVGNDNNTATAQWDDATLKPSGFSQINEAGNATDDAHSGAFYKIADGTEGATTSVPAQSAANYWGFYIRVTGASTTNPINAFGADFNATGNAVSHAITSIASSGTNTLAFYVAAADGGDTYPFSVSGTGWSEGDEIRTGAAGTDAAGTWGTRSMTTPGATGNATVNMSVSDGASGFQFSLNPGSVKGSIMSPEIDFDSVSGQLDWGEVVWSVTEPSNTDTKLRVYYSSTTACDQIVPDRVLPGNSAGFDDDDSGTHINELSTSTYNRICLKMTFDRGAGVSSPTLNDWGVRWVITSQFTQSNYQWYVNQDAITPTDPWPAGGTDLVLNEPITEDDGVLGSDELRLRMSLTGSSSSAIVNSSTFKLQYAEGDTCSASLSWQDVGGIGSTTAFWRGYDNPSLADGATVSSTVLTGSTVNETYEESNNTTPNPNAITPGSVAEWDWVIQNNAATGGVNYCFRMVYSDGTLLKTYTNYPSLVTNSSPTTPVTYTPFDNEKLASTSPYFEFVSNDPEGQELDYQIQIDNDSDFGSAVIDTDTETNIDDFFNTVSESDKSPFNNAQRMRYIIPSSLTNGTTYWWRVRAKDGAGSGNYGNWSTSQSFTIDTSVTVSTWYQTTEEQFDTDTLEGTDATAADLVSFASGSTTGTTTSSAIDFDNATVGNAWGEFSFNETGAANNILYHLEYYNGSDWAVIPNSALAGNVAGYDTSPVDLLDLDTTTYNIIRVRADFRAGSPTLLDWTIGWGERVSVPTHITLFDNEKTGTTTPTFTFYSTDPQSQDLEYEFSWSTSSTFTTGSTTRNSNTAPAGFANETTSGDTLSPFISGDTISYKIQSADALTASTTYWWRVRAKDPGGSDSFSFWSDPWSFTTATSGETVNVSTWFQTIGDQFDNGTVSGLTVATGSVGVGGGIAVQSSFTSNTAVPGISLSLTKPTGVVPGDLLLIIVGNDNTTATAQWNNTTLKPGGFTLINEAGNATPDAHVAAFYRIADGNEQSATSTTAQSNVNYWGYYIRVTGASTTNPINVIGTDYAVNNLLTHPITAITTTVDQAMAFYILGGDGGDTYPFSVSGTGWTESAEIQAGTLGTNAAGTWGTRLMTTAGNTGNASVLMTVNDGASGFQFSVNPATISSGSITSPEIDFDDGSGPAWGELSWRDTEPGSSQILYQLEYLNSGGEWDLIPDSALSGNSTGFTNGPVNLETLDTATYNEIRIVGNFNCSGANCPSLQDWTVTWSRGFMVSGTAFEYDGVSSTTAGTVAIAVNGALQTGKTGTIAANGTWFIDFVTFFAGDIVTVFVSDGTATATSEAVGITEYDGSPDITGMRLQKRHLTIGSDDYATISNDEIELYDFTDNENVFYDVNAGNDLTMCADLGCTDASIRILPLNTYDPGTGGDVTTHDVRNYGTLTAGANTIRVSGSWDDNATTTLTNSTVIFTATTSTEFIDENDATTTGFNNLTFGETSGTATWNASSTLDINGNLSVTFGTFARGSTSLTVAGNVTTGASGFWTGMGTTTIDGTNPSTWTDSNATRQNIGRVVVDGSAKTLLLGSSTTLQSLTVGADDIFDASISGYAVSVYENWIINNTFTARTGNVIFIATTTNRVITAGGDSFYDLTFNGVGGSWSFTEANLSVTNDLTIATGTVTMPTGTTTLAGSFSSVGGTFAHNNALLYFTSSGAETISASTTAFTNAFYNMRFTGAGSWTFRDTSATTSNDILITQGTVTFPSNTLTVGGSFTQTGGSFVHNSGTVKFTSATAKVIDINGSSFYGLSFVGSGSWSFADASVTALDDVTISAGTVTFPSSTFTIGGSLTNTATITHNSGTVLFDSTDTGETISLGNSSLYNMTFNSTTGGWTVSASATSTNNVSLTNASTFTLSNGATLSVGGTFTNSVSNASTTWTGSTLSLEAGNYAMNVKTNDGDTYDTLRVKTGAQIQMWNSSASTYTVQNSASLYSQDHNAADGDLYIFGDYTRSSGTEYWSYGTDFDGTALTASTSRQVDVRFESGATVAFTGSTLNMTGTTSATTTAANQGSGTYTIDISGGTTTARYYSFVNLGSTGVSLLSSNKVTSLQNGAISPGIGGGTGFTISSTTIDANPQLQIYNVDFSTTSSIVANNVKQIDGTPSSYWWFRQSTGSIDGESYDLDTGNPGSIRWDDSSLLITISGVVYEDDGVTRMGSSTCNGVTQNINIVVQNGSTYTGSCSAADGTYSIPSVAIVGDPVLTIYLNTNGGTKGTVVTRTPTADITDLDIYQNRIITRHEDVDPLTIMNMAVFDYDNDTDIRYTAATGTLTVFAGNELHIASSTTFAPGGNITINGNASSTSQDGSLHIDDNATFTGSATSTYTLAGSFTLDAGATFTAASTSIVMNATTTGKTITTTATQEITLNDLTFSGVGGGWNINGDIRSLGSISVSTGTVSGTADITLVNGSLSGDGTLSMGSGTTTLEKTNTLGGTTPWTFGNLVLGNGSVTGTTTPGSNATTTILGKLTIGTGHFLKAGGSLWNLSGTGNVFVENGTFVEGTSTVRYSGAGATNVISTTYYNLDLKAQGSSPTYTATGLGIMVSNNLTVGGPNTTTFTLDTNDPALDVSGMVTIDSTGTFVGSNSGSFTVSGSWDNNGTYTASGGTVTFYGSGSPTIAAGNSSFANLTINGSGSFSISEPATSTNAFTLTSAGTFTLASGQSLGVGGTFTNAQGGGATTWTGSVLYLYGGGNYSLNASTTGDTFETLRIGSGTQIRMWNSSASTYDTHSTASLYSQDHNAVDGDLYIYGAYTKTSGADYWDYTIDFDGANIASAPRSVDVYIQSGSSILYTGGSLAVVGGQSASTTIQNQGGGTYSFRIGGSASTTWSYYQIRNTDSSGLVFSGTPTVTSISNGDFEVSQNSGTALTVGGTVITQNPAKTFTSNAFGTSTGVSPAFNVTATGTSASSWRFTNHIGSIDGEAYDVDPNGDPGYVVWDDSSANITISGTVYSGEGSGVSSACDGSFDIHIRVEGLTSYTGTCDGGTGAYSISGILYSPGDSLVVYIDGKAVKAATVTEDPISNISGLDLYEDRVIVRHEGADPLSIVDMSFWDSSDDADIPFTAVDSSPDTLTLPANTKLIVWTNKTFEPNGNVTVSGGGGGAAHDGTLELYANAVFDATGSETHTIGGSLISGAGASIDDETSTFIFTTSGSARTIDTNDNSFYNLSFNGSGSWTVTNSTLDIGNDFAIAQGAVTLPSGTTTVTGSLNVTSGSFITGTSSSMVFNSPVVETIKPGTSTFGSLVINASGSFTMLGTNATVTKNLLIQDGTFTSATGTLTIGGDFINRDTFTHGSGILRFTATSSAVVTASSSDLYSITFSGGGAYTFTDTDKALLGSLRIESGSVALATGTMSIGGSFLNTGGSFNNGSGTILFNSADTGETINPGNSAFYNLTLASAGGGWTISGNATTTGNFSLTSATNFTVSSSTRLYVGGVFTNLVGGAATTWTGSTLHIDSGSSYTINTKLVGGDVYNILEIGSSTALRAWDSTGNITLMDTTSSLYSQDHAGVSGSLYIYGNYSRTTGTDYWSYATDFDGTALGGSSRQAFVYIAPNATTTVNGGTLAIVGANGFDTTIANQGGTSTYAFTVSGGELNAQYYSFANMDTNGLNVSGDTTLISSLTEGNFTLAVNGGSLITVSSSTLNYNTGITISGVSFATTTAITGSNVKVVGTTPSAWTFTGHTGNFDGEAFDNDGIDDCGSVRWDDSTCLLTQQSAFRFRNDDGGEGVPNSEWYNTNWSKRKRVTITNADATGYTNAVVKVAVPYDSDMQADFDDLRFTDSTGLTLLSHFIESYTPSTDAVVWVKIPTLATSTDTHIYMYYGNGTASSSSATTTFSVMDNFEDGNITEYSGQPAQFTVGNTSAYEGTYRLDASDVNLSKTTQILRNTNVTVRQGETIRFFEYIDTTSGSNDESCAHFGVQSASSSYAVCLELFGVDRMSIAKNAVNRDTSGTVLSSTTVTYTTGWYEVEVDWGTNNLISATLKRNGSVVATTSVTDSSYTSGGIGFTLWGFHGGWDVFSSRPLLTNEPTTTIGFEQVNGGASWAGALNGAASGIDIDENFRVRFLIENSGLPITNQNYEIEYAAKGNAPSCESVNFASYVEVPNAASCGTSDICMVTSSQFTNLASTTDVLGGSGTFSYGQIVEDPSNNTGNVSVNANEFTELEYALKATTNADDSNYCLRVSNEGTDLDSYTHVAELGLQFDPTVTALTLNGGADITLMEGATTTVTATGTVSDQNGYADLIDATTTMFRSGVGESCVADNNNCYIAGNSACSFSNCSGNSCDVSCSADFYYHADPTDAGTYGGETWRATLSVVDTTGSVASGTAPSIDLSTLRAISVDTGINYGTLQVNADTGAYNATTTIQNIGNAAIDVLIEGSDLTNGASSIIPVFDQKYSTTTFTYSACTVCAQASSTATQFELDLSKPASTTPQITDQLFWGLFVPFGVAGTAHQGVNTLYATGD